MTPACEVDVAWSSAIASPIRIPVTASSPISVRCVAARNGEWIVAVAAINAAISASE